jgi:hypothetical protein
MMGTMKLSWMVVDPQEVGHTGQEFVDEEEKCKIKGTYLF